MRALALALLLMVCASAGGEGMSADWASNSWTDAANVGNGRWFIRCTGSASGCTRRAAAVCGRGFQVITTDAQLNPAGGVTASDAFDTRGGHSMTVQCS